MQDAPAVPIKEYSLTCTYKIIIIITDTNTINIGLNGKQGIHGESHSYKETSLVVESGLDRSLTVPEPLCLCWVEQEGANGPDTGVSPVPPSISESKLKRMPAVGVVMGMPSGVNIAVGTGRLVGRLPPFLFGGRIVMLDSGSLTISSLESTWNREKLVRSIHTTFAYFLRASTTKVWAPKAAFSVTAVSRQYSLVMTTLSIAGSEPYKASRKRKSKNRDSRVESSTLTSQLISSQSYFNY